MDGKIKEIIENEMDCLITDVDFVIKKEGSLQALVNMLEAAINYTRCCTQLLCVDIDNSINMDITIGKEYELLKEDRGNYIIKNDKGKTTWYRKKFFKQIFKQ